ncbi:hypothetical protein NOVO_05055 [Rickettsiales bacterium Ac37b]|nr:hypothetical protein NOVO_05055 [Rickettsiales bacterium Ac37b]
MSNIYTIHVKNNDFNNAVLIKEGNFCLTALIFGIFWALYHRMWLIALILLGINILIGNTMHSQIITEIGGAVLQLCINIIFSLFAYDLRRITLSLKGYKIIDIMRGTSSSDAQYRWLDYQELSNKYS